MVARKVAIISLCATLMVAAATLAAITLLQKKNNDDDGDKDAIHNYINQSQKAIKDLCQNTYYHQTCIDTLSKASNSSDPKILIATSFHTAIHELGHVIAQTRPLQEADNDPKMAGAYKTCHKLLDDSAYDLQRTIDQITSFDISDFRALIDDIKTWLTGALTYQETCLDCFEEVNNDEAGEKMKKLLKLSRELTINGLALVNEFSDFLVPAGHEGGGRLLMAHTENLKEYNYRGRTNKGKLIKDPQRTRNLLQTKEHIDYDYGYDYRGRLNKGKATKGPQSTRNLIQTKEHIDYDYGYDYRGRIGKDKATKGPKSTRNLLQAKENIDYDYGYDYRGRLNKGKATKGPQSTHNLIQTKEHIDYDYDYDYRGRIGKDKATKGPESTRNLLQAKEHIDYDYGYDYRGRLNKGKATKGPQSTRNLLQTKEHIDYDYGYDYRGRLNKGKATKASESKRNLLQAKEHIDYDYGYDYRGRLNKGKATKGPQSTRNLLQTKEHIDYDYDYDYRGRLNKGKATKGSESKRNLLQAKEHIDYDYGYDYRGRLNKGKATKGPQSTRNLIQTKEHIDYDYGYDYRGRIGKDKATKGPESTRNLLQAKEHINCDYGYDYRGRLNKGKATKGPQSTRNLLQTKEHIDYDYGYDYKGRINKGRATKSPESTRNLIQTKEHIDYDYGYDYRGRIGKGKATKGPQSTRNLLQTKEHIDYNYDYDYRGRLNKSKATKGPQSTRNLLQTKEHIDYDYGYDYRGINKGNVRKGPQRTRNLLQAELASIRPNVIVAQDGSGKYRTINEALLEAPQKSNETFVIYIKEGVYPEYITVNRTSWSIMFIGDGPTKTRIIGNRSKIGGFETFESSTVAIEGDNFIARDMGFENNAGPDMHQAVAVRVSADKTIFHNCQIDGFQDTLYAHNHRQYYRDCTISGTIDFIFGNARAVLQNCTLVVRKPLESQKLCMVTAQGRTAVNETSAVVLQNCRIVAAPDYPVEDKSYEAFLGRPWKEFSRTIVMDSEISGFINPGGWSTWNGTDAHLNTCWYAEVGNVGPGADLTRRVRWPGIKRVSAEEAEAFTPGEYMTGGEWIAAKGLPYDSGRRRPVQLH